MSEDPPGAKKRQVEGADDTSLPTGTAPKPLSGRSRRTPSGTSAVSGISATQQGRFGVGEILNERYRILGLLGKGGMGEVYRADDLLLGEAVALKFLPEALSRDADRLERFRNEVRIARQISHPVVCRVHDLGAFEGQPFLSMEYIDGEDLKSLLKRIGRMPGDKALEMARRLAAGLAAAHDRGVLHRDLKPENVMIDGEGEVRITDFGLAALSDAIERHDVRSGTPAYMSPEQLAGREVTVASDVYALGLVLYELFTGKRAFTGRSLQELMQQHADSGVATPSSLVSEIDPAIEGLILRCLEKDPAQRPQSALAVAAALPGADPLAAALAAGETPSPELVAAAGRKGGLAPRWAWAGLAFALIGLVAVPLLSSSQELVAQVPTELSPQLLEDRARAILRQAGYEPGVDSRGGFLYELDYFRHVEANDPSPGRWDGLATGRPAVLPYWYRESPHPLVSGRGSGRVGVERPPPILSGMTMVIVDTKGRLVELEAVPPQVDEPADAAPVEPDWGPLFEAAGLDLEAFSPVEPRWSPGVFADTRAAWTGVYDDRPELEVRVEAAGYRGQPVYFRLLGEWSRPWRMRPFALTGSQRVAQALMATLLVAVSVLATFLARRHWKMGRGDRRGALRLGVVVFAANLLSSMLYADHHAASSEIGLLSRAFGRTLLGACLIWILYMAVEPYVRRRWPHRLISWTRLLSGAWRDPLVGRDVLLGTCAGAAMACLVAAFSWLPDLLGTPAPRPEGFNYDVLLGTRETLSSIIDFGVQAVALAMGFSVLLLVLQVVLRKEILAAAALILILGAQQGLGSEIALWISLPFGLLVWSIPILALLRSGLLAFMFAMLVVFLVANLPLSARLGHWTAGPTLWSLAVVAAVALWGFYTSLGGRSPFGEALLDD